MKKDSGVRVRKSRNGKGIFALRTFAESEIVYEVTGREITGDEDEMLSERDRDNAFRYSGDTYITPGDSIGAFQNHSCEPNAKVVKKGRSLYVAAATDIGTGEEVCIDYSTITGADDMWEMSCNCGQKNCREMIRSIEQLPKALRASYTRRGMIPRYIPRT